MDEEKLRGFISVIKTCTKQFDKIDALSDPEGHVFDDLSSHITEMEALVVLPSARAKFSGVVTLEDGEEANIVQVFATLIPSLLAFTTENEAATQKIVLKVLGILQKLSNEPSMRELMVLPSVSLLKTLCEVISEVDFNTYRHDILMIFLHLSQDTSSAVKVELVKCPSLMQSLLDEIGSTDINIRLISMSLSIIGYMVLDKDVRTFISTQTMSLEESVFGLLCRMKNGQFEFDPSRESDIRAEERMSEEEYNSLLKESRISALWIVRSIVQEAAGMKFVKENEENFQLVYNFALTNKKSDDHILHIFETILFSSDDGDDNTGNTGNYDDLLLQVFKLSNTSLSLLAKYDIHEFFVNVLSSGKKKMKNNMNAKRSLHLLLLLSLSTEFLEKMQLHVKLQSILWDFMKSDQGYVGLRSALLLTLLYCNEEEFYLFASKDGNEESVGGLLSFRLGTENLILPIIHKYLSQIVAIEGPKQIEEHAIGHIPLLLVLSVIRKLGDSNANITALVTFFYDNFDHFDPLLKCLHFEEWAEKRPEGASTTDGFSAKEVTYAFLTLSTLFFDERLIQKYGYFGIKTWTAPPAPSQGFTIIGDFMSYYVNELDGSRYEHFDTSMYNICSWWLQKYYFLSQSIEKEVNDSNELLVLLHYSNIDFHYDDKMATLFAQEDPLLDKNAVELNCFDLSVVMKDTSMLISKQLITNFHQEMSFANIQVVFLSPSFRDDIMMRYLMMEMDDFYSTFDKEGKGNTIFVQWEPDFIFDGNGSIKKDLGWIHNVLTDESKYTTRKMTIIGDPTTMHDEIKKLLGESLKEEDEKEEEREEGSGESKEDVEEEKEDGEVGEKEPKDREKVDEEVKKEDEMVNEEKRGEEEEKKEEKENFGNNEGDTKSKEGTEEVSEEVSEKTKIDRSKEETTSLCTVLVSDMISRIIDQQEQEKRINQVIVSSFAQGIVSSKLTSTIKSISNQISYERDIVNYERDKASKEVSIDQYTKKLADLEFQHQSQEHEYLDKIELLQTELQEKAEQEKVLQTELQEKAEQGKVLQEQAIQEKLIALEQQRQSQENSYLEKIKELQVALQEKTEKAVPAIVVNEGNEATEGDAYIGMINEDESIASSAVDDEVIENDERNEIEEGNSIDDLTRSDDIQSTMVMAPVEPHDAKPSYTSPLRNIRGNGNGNVDGGLSSTFASASMDEYGQNPGIFEGNSISSQSILLNSHVPLPGGFSVNPQESTIDIGDPLEYLLNVNKLKASSLDDMKALLTELGIDSTFELLQCDADTLERIGSLLKPIPQRVFLKELNNY